MRILVIDQAPRSEAKNPPYDVDAITALLNSYASPGTTVEIGFPDNFEGAQDPRFDRIAEQAERSAPHDGSACNHPQDLLGAGERL